MSRHHEDLRTDLSDLPDVFTRSATTPLLPSRTELDAPNGGRRSRRTRSVLDDPPDYYQAGYGDSATATATAPPLAPTPPPADAPYLPGTERLRAALDPELADHPLLLGLLRELPPRQSAPDATWLDRWLGALRANLDLIYGTRS